MLAAITFGFLNANPHELRSQLSMKITLSLFYDNLKLDLKKNHDSYSLRGIAKPAIQLLKDKVPFDELGVDFLDQLEPERKARYHAKRLEELGYEVSLTQKVA